MDNIIYLLWYNELNTEVPETRWVIKYVTPFQIIATNWVERGTNYKYSEMTLIYENPSI